jgi:uncharacterized protein YyaL (SSP411 family)
MALKYAAKIANLYLPDVVLAGTKNQSSLPFLNNRYNPHQNLFYLCQNKTCSEPITNFQEIISKLS